MFRMLFLSTIKIRRAKEGVTRIVIAITACPVSVYVTIATDCSVSSHIHWHFYFMFSQMAFKSTLFIFQQLQFVSFLLNFIFFPPSNFRQICCKIKLFAKGRPTHTCIIIFCESGNRSHLVIYTRRKRRFLEIVAN